MRIHGSAPRDRRPGADRAAAVFFGSVFKQPVSVLRKEARPDQSAAVGRRRLCAAVQAHGERRRVSVASHSGRDAVSQPAGVPLADRGIVHRPAEGKQAHRSLRLVTQSFQQKPGCFLQHFTQNLPREFSAQTARHTGRFAVSWEQKFRGRAPCRRWKPVFPSC